MNTLRNFLWATFSGVLFASLGLAVAFAVMHVAYTPEQLLGDPVFGTQLVPDWGRIIPALTGLVNLLVGLFAGPKLRAVWDVFWDALDDKHKPDADVSDAMELLVTRLLLNRDLDAATTQVLIRAVREAGE